MQIKPASLAASKYLAIALGVSIPVSVALDNVLLALLLLAFLPFGYRSYWEECKTNPLARAAFLLFMALLAGCAYGEATLDTGLGTLGKYADLAFIPLLLVIFRDERVRRAALSAFLVLMGVTLLLSILVGHGLIPYLGWMNEQAFIAEPAIFHGYIAQNHLMAFAAFLFILKFMQTQNPQAKLGYALLALLAAYDVLFLVSARTGPLVLFGLLLYLAWAWAVRSARLDLKKLFMGAGAMLLAIVLAWQFSPKFHDRIVLAGAEFQKWDPQRPVVEVSSIGARLEFYYQTVQIIREHPLLGVGTGGFGKAYADKAAPRGIVLLVQNPHNEYLLATAQLGLVGLGLLLYLFYAMWKSARSIKDNFHRHAGMGLVVSTMLVCLFNSPLLDHTEGLFFAFMGALFFANLNGREKAR